MLAQKGATNLTKEYGKLEGEERIDEASNDIIPLSLT